jgi:hypothetical protein
MAHGGKREGAGRPKKSSLSPLRQQQIKDEINAKSILRRLHGLVMGQVEMSSPAVAAAGILLRKVMPDLAAVEHSGEIATKSAEFMSDNELASIASTSSDNPAPAPIDPSKLN